MVSEEQQAYARWLDRGTRLGLVLLIGAFLVYVAGLLPPLIPLDRLPELWGLPADKYLALTGAPAGWGWLGSLGSGDYLNLLGIAVLALCTVACYLRILPIQLARGERLAALITIAQAAVLLLAASGVLAGGH